MRFHDELQRAAGLPLRERHVGCCVQAARRSACPDVAHNADNVDPTVIEHRPSPDQPLLDRRPYLQGEALADHGHLRREEVIARRERTAGEDIDAHDREIVPGSP